MPSHENAAWLPSKTRGSTTVVILRRGALTFRCHTTPVRRVPVFFFYVHAVGRVTPLEAMDCVKLKYLVMENSAP